jgi:hypothetical protein
VYQNKKHLRDHEIKVRFDELTLRAIDALAELTRKQRAVLLRDLVTDEIYRRLRKEESDGCDAIGRA